MKNEAIAIQFFAEWGKSFDEMCASFEHTFSSRCRWDQRPLAITVGTKDAIRFLQRSRRFMGLATIDVEVLKIASAGDSVLCERVDHLRRSNGNLIASAAVVGILDFKQGKIISWREYYDALDLIRQGCMNGLKRVSR